MGEVLFTISLLAGLIAPFLLMTGIGRKYWVVTMSLCCLSVVSMEVYSTLTTGYSISKHFWKWSTLHPMSGHIVLVCLALGWSSLIIHLGWKMWTEPGYGLRKQREERDRKANEESELD